MPQESSAGPTAHGLVMAGLPRRSRLDRDPADDAVVSCATWSLLEYRPISEWRGVLLDGLVSSLAPRLSFFAARGVRTASALRAAGRHGWRGTLRGLSISKT
jgi:hypothetical protein